MDVVRFSVLQFQFFILVLVRVTGIMTFSPFYGAYNIPKVMKIGISILIALVVFPMVSLQIDRGAIVLPKEMSDFAICILCELFIGFSIGFVVFATFAGIQMGGHYIGQQMGLTLANVIDPVTGIQISILDQLHFVIAMLVFLLMNGHHFLLGALVKTFEAIPIPKMSFTHFDVVGNILTDEIAGDMFVIALKVAAPAIVALFLTTVAIGILGRAVPEMNIFIIGFGVRIMVGLFVLVLSIPYLVRVFEFLFERVFDNIERIVELM